MSYPQKVVFDIHLLAEGMSLRGHQVYVLYYESLWSEKGISDGLWIHKKLSDEIMSNRALANAHVTLIRPKFIKLPVVSRISAFATHYLEIKRVIKEKEIDAIVLYSVPTNGLQTIYWAKKLGIPVIFRSIDVLNQLTPYSVLRPAVRFLERQVYSRVDRILTITPKLSEYVIKMGANPDKVGVLPMPVDTHTFCPSEDTRQLRQKWGISDDDKVILFMGTLFNFSGLGGFIPQFKYVLNKFPETKLLIVGDGEQRQELESIIKTTGLQGKVIITGFQPYQDMPRYINMADVCINTFVRNKITNDIFPGKTVQFLACGKPLVTRLLDGIKAVIDGEEQGVVYANEDWGLVVKIISLLDSPERMKRIGDNGLRYTSQFHRCEQVAKKLEEELGRLIEAKCG